MAFFSKLAGANDNSNPKSTASCAQQQRSYRSVEIIPHQSGHCAAVEELTGYRILADEAPPLPLAGCDHAKCRCRYAPYTDRRAGSRRNAEFRIGSVASMFKDDSGRSDAPGRRTDDQD